MDDSADDHFLFQRAVQRTGTPLLVQPFFWRKQAIAYLRGNPPFEDRSAYPVPAFILCDYNLRLTKGPKLIPVIRALPSCAALPIIIFSGYEGSECVLTSYAAGADHFLRKPVRSERWDIIVQTLYACATSEPQRFEVLARLEEYQPPPQTTTRAASVGLRHAT